MRKGGEVPRFLHVCHFMRTEIDPLITFLLTVLVFGVIITLHELGHFTFAKLFGVRVNEFSFGMGPKLFSFGKHETQYSIRALPIGGYVAMEGEDEESGDGRAFCNKPAWQRFIILFAGAFMNIVLGLLLLGIITAQMSLLPMNMVAEFYPGSTSAQVLQSTDRIIKVNGYSTNNYNDLIFQLIRDEDGVVDLTVLRGADPTLTAGDRIAAKFGKSDKALGEIIQIPGHAFQMEDNGQGGKSLVIDFQCYGKEPTFFSAVGYAFEWTASTVKQVWYSLLDIVTGRFGLSEISGPVGTATIIQQASSQGIRSFLVMVAMITINVGVFNLLPIPALDGGRLLFLLVEIIRRKPVPAKYESVVHAVGLVLMLGLIAVVTFSDIMKLLGR